MRDVKDYFLIVMALTEVCAQLSSYLTLREEKAGDYGTLWPNAQE